jgi:hypothetical protein
MRHLWSLLAGIVAAPLAWLALATGQHRAEQSVVGWQESGRFDTVDLIGPVIVLVVAGVLLGVVGTLRWSPAGALAAGLLLVTPTLFMFINPFEILDAFSYPETNRFLGQDLQLWQPVQNGTLLVLGALLLVAVFSTQRWRQWPHQPEPVRYPTDDEVALGGSAGAGSAMSDEEIVAAATSDQPEDPARPPDADQPEADRSEADRSEADQPEADQPEADRSDPDQPEADRSDPDQPEADRSDPDQPGEPPGRSDNPEPPTR